MSPQSIATPVTGQGDMITYNIIPQYQNVVVIGPDGSQDNGQTMVQSSQTSQQGTMKTTQVGVLSWLICAFKLLKY